MVETILSVGIDVGTSTTEVIFSELGIENLAGAFTVPRIQITDKHVVYRSPIHPTPLSGPRTIDAEALQQLVLDEYVKAGVRPEDVGTGAAIITGETARAENADPVLMALSDLAGDFVVATAGPLLESVLAARGAGTDSWSEQHSGIVANLDIGGGTTNIAVYRGGQLLGTSCLDIGGRLIRVERGLLSYISPSMLHLAASGGIQMRIGDHANPDVMRSLTRLMARQLAMAVGLVERDVVHADLYTNDLAPLPLDFTPETIGFSGGVADLLGAPAGTDPMKYGDIGQLLAWAIDDDSAFQRVVHRESLETIAATVVGAGVHTTEVSGSTIEYAVHLLPMRNIPIVRIPHDAEQDPATLVEAIRSGLSVVRTQGLEGGVAIAMLGDSAGSFQGVQTMATAIIDGAQEVLEGPHPLVIILERDRAKALGQSLAIRRGRRDDVVCIDSVQTTTGDYIDIGEPVGSGNAVPVVIKTLVFND